MLQELDNGVFASQEVGVDYISHAMVMAAASYVGEHLVRQSEPSDEELKYGDPEDPEAKAYIPAGWKTVYLWRAPDLWMA